MEEKIIYCLTCLVNGKKYVGQSNIGLEYRWKKHVKDSNRKPVKGYIGRAIKKYGSENFIREVIKVCVDQRELDYYENYYIKKLNTRNKKFGYNIREGGKGGRHCESSKMKNSLSHRGNKNPMFQKKFSDLHRKRLSESHRGKIFTIEHRKSLSENHKGMLGKHHTIYTKKIISKANKGRKLSKASIEKIRNSKLGFKNPMFGKHFKEESKKKLSISVKKALNKLDLSGRNHPMFGKHWSKEQRKRISEGAKRRWNLRIRNQTSIL